MNAGKMRHLVQIISLTEARNAIGEVTRTTTEATTRWAAIETLRGEELIEGQRVDANVTHKITMRYSSDLTPSHQIGWNSRTFHPLWIEDVDQRGITTMAMCKEDI